MATALATAAIAPCAARDLRGQLVGELNFPAGSLLVVAGVPGAGKTTLLKRLLPQAGVRLLDSEHGRVRLSRYFGALPYKYWRPLVHASHYVRLYRALRGPESIVVHESGTRSWARRLITGAARRADRRTHLLLLDVDPGEALAGQRTRNRKVRPSVFAAHCRNWQRLLREVADSGHPIHREAATITVIDRAVATELSAIRFTGPHLVPDAPVRQLSAAA
ncbi:AAA family ATPase [Actinoplanes palleronii]|uniref:ATP-binding protein n=1 Tax=Actinoplanes palleronii TaxID=113570 RepID=A0ABQ4BA21_9ACTN|nr:AAA family ATPase [Actinoplanes palleronii]GIE67090.1 ATP-binding protein [Actinoplanes palleronii]